jgi:hypothetical protein
VQLFLWGKLPAESVRQSVSRAENFTLLLMILLS